ncbi:ATP-binding protein [Pseudoalteromonas sp. NBT06-2]|uniref:AAA family ATPase n=1 Tax=Pseudoalteromonas sp. NBT06-2 TaxID=2025950 RepID=UPI001BB0A087|nr:ATP-binding protein [Pseudoalteromonas sp. NBT06-2]
MAQDRGLANKIRPSYRALFHGPPETDKTMTACLLGESTGSDFYQVNLSLIIFKYVGETENNVEKVFSMAEHKSWILFFDEADALFGKRAQTKSENDQFSNQNVAYPMY